MRAEPTPTAGRQSLDRRSIVAYRLCRPSVGKRRGRPEEVRAGDVASSRRRARLVPGRRPVPPEPASFAAGAARGGRRVEDLLGGRVARPGSAAPRGRCVGVVLLPRLIATSRRLDRRGGARTLMAAGGLARCCSSPASGCTSARGRTEAAVAAAPPASPACSRPSPSSALLYGLVPVAASRSGSRSRSGAAATALALRWDAPGDRLRSASSARSPRRALVGAGADDGTGSR